MIDIWKILIAETLYLINSYDTEDTWMIQM